MDWAKKVGEYAVKTIEHQFECKANNGALLACEKLKKLARSFGQERFESACEYAFSNTELTVKSIGSILRHNLDSQRLETFSPIVVTEHDNVRGSHYFGGQQ